MNTPVLITLIICTTLLALSIINAQKPPEDKR